MTEHLGQYEEALWAAVSAGGDIDTICAIVGGITVMAGSIKSIPDAWKQSREPVPSWSFLEQLEEGRNR